MEKGYLPIGEAAKQARMTSETLRHYDRIGLVKPSMVDPHTGYRYYSAEDIVRLNTVGALQQMDLSLRDIKQVLEYSDLEAIVAFLEQAERQADEKIRLLRQGKEKIRKARASYEEKLRDRRAEGDRRAAENRLDAPSAGIPFAARQLPERVIMLGDPVETVTVDDLWGYLRHFNRRLSPDQREQFAFEDLAGIYRDAASSRYFAVCTGFVEMEDLRTVPAGTYLCADCDEWNWRETLEHLTAVAEKKHGVHPAFCLQLVVVSGILQWTYQLQVPVEG